MAILVIDLKTSGLPRRDIPLGDVGQPWPIKIAAEHSTMDGRTTSRIDIAIKPEGRKMKPEAEAMNGVDLAEAERVGLQENAVLALLTDMVKKSLYVVSFGDLDRWVIESMMVALAVRSGKPSDTYRKPWQRPGLQYIDIQTPACKEACKIASGRDDGDYKWPTLDEAWKIVLGQEPTAAKGDAWADLCRIKQIFLALKERGHFGGTLV